ncbi:disulfide bond formation protein B [Pseudomonas sp. LJDD11]|uniref:disulfide bond formation protein B n=1 Tax=Pseudomonas sp. LJDD11 TaxID=2931984 RepID=UPI00211CDEBB|nr:disulfide bond formation protein B [Pseudomonas sp. LJDD11]MCQ9425951.1 disulfide bond formation protein B [Pseudomonas sp. LJDD11]
MHLARTRVLFLMAFIACALSLGAALWLQHGFNLEPCLLCRWQRVLLALAGLICLAAALHGPSVRGWRRYAGGLLLAAVAGAGVAGAQVWLQTSSPEQFLAVTNALERSFDNLALDAWGDLLQGESRLCAEINWSLFGISLPEWSLLCFAGLMLLALYPLSGQIGRRIRGIGQDQDQTLV